MKQIAIILIMLVALNSNAQNISMGGGSGAGDSDGTENFKFMPIPYLSYDRSIGFQLGLLPMAMYTLNKKDTVSPQSVSGLMGIYTTNKSWFVLAFSKFFLKEDKWRLGIGAGIVSVNFQTYVDVPVGGFIDYNTSADFFKIKAQRRIAGKIFLGLHYTYSAYNTRFEGIDEPNITYLNGLGLILSRDSRDNVYYPVSGGESEIDWITYPVSINEQGDVNKIELSHNHFIGVKDNRDIVALRVYIGFGVGEPIPFEQQFIVGQTDIRGYTQGKYRGNAKYTLQGEYRWNFRERFGLVGFFGLATISGANNEADNGVILPGIGAGFRYTAFEKNHFNVGLDAAAGKDDWGIYFRIGEAF